MIRFYPELFPNAKEGDEVELTDEMAEKLLMRTISIK